MTSKSNKYTLLDKNQQKQQQFDMIQMVDMDPSKKGTYNQNRNTQQVQYVSLDDQQQKTNKNKKPDYPPLKVQQSASGNANQKKPTQQAQQAQKQPQQQYINPTYSSNPNPSRIQMNGTTYRNQNAPEPRKSKIPQMKVQCTHCTYEQQVPGNTQVYVCCCCNNMSQCYPLYGLFICGYCQSKVCYPYGTSNMIRCTRCATVNSVPTQPQKRYTSQLPQQQQKQPQQQSPKKMQQKKVEQKKFQQKDERLEREIDFFGEQQIIQQQNDPTKKIIKQQEISFDQVPSLADMQEKELNYSSENYPGKGPKGYGNNNEQL